MAAPGTSIAAQRRFVSWLAVVCLIPGCISLGGPADHTITHATPELPDASRWQPGEPRLEVVFERANLSVGEGERFRDVNGEAGFRRMFLRAGVFDRIWRAPAPEIPHRVRFERHYVEESHQAANLAKAAVIPGLTGYRFGVASTWRLLLEREGEEPRVFEVYTSLTRVYYAANDHDAVRGYLYRRIDELNFQGLVHRLRVDPELFQAR